MERPVTIYHILKLFQTGNNATLSELLIIFLLFEGQPTDHNSLMKNQRTVVSEFYDEIIFQVYFGDIIFNTNV